MKNSENSTDCRFFLNEKNALEIHELEKLNSDLWGLLQSDEEISEFLIESDKLEICLYPKNYSVDLLRNLLSFLKKMESELEIVVNWYYSEECKEDSSEVHRPANIRDIGEALQRDWPFTINVLPVK